MEELVRVTKSRAESLENKAKVTHTLIFPTTVYGSKNWTVKKTNSKKVNLCETWCWGELCRRPGPLGRYGSQGT